MLLNIKYALHSIHQIDWRKRSGHEFWTYVASTQVTGVKHVVYGAGNQERGFT